MADIKAKLERPVLLFFKYLTVFVNYIVLWTPTPGVQFLVPASKRIYGVFYKKVYLPQSYLVFFAASAFSVILLFVGHLSIINLNDYWKRVLLVPTLACVISHVCAIVLAHVSPKTFQRIGFVIVIVSFTVILFAVNGVSLINATVSRLVLSCTALLLLVSTIYFQRSLVISIIVWCFFVPSGVSEFVSKSEKNEVLEQVRTYVIVLFCHYTTTSNHLH